MSRIADLRDDYDYLGLLLKKAEGSGAAAITRERRLLGELLEQLEITEEVPRVDQLAAKRRAKAGDSRPPSRRRQSG